MYLSHRELAPATVYPWRNRKSGLTNVRMVINHQLIHLAPHEAYDLANRLVDAAEAVERMHKTPNEKPPRKKAVIL